MDRRELLNDPMTATLAAFAGLKSELWTAIPGIIQSYHPDTQTASVQPAIQYQIQSQDGSWNWVQLPLLVDCPVFFPSGGGVSLTFPLAQGDECLMVFAQRCIDAWWQSGGYQNNQVEFRMLDPSDGFCLPGVNSKPHVPGSQSTTNAELRSDDGAAKVSINPTTHEVSVSTSGTLNLSASTVNITGTLNINGAAYLAHVHSVGGGTTGGVV